MFNCSHLVQSVRMDNINLYFSHITDLHKMVNVPRIQSYFSDVPQLFLLMNEQYLEYRNLEKINLIKLWFDHLFKFLTKNPESRKHNLKILPLLKIWKNILNFFLPESCVLDLKVDVVIVIVWPTSYTGEYTNKDKPINNFTYDLKKQTENKSRFRGWGRCQEKARKCRWRCKYICREFSFYLVR